MTANANIALAVLHTRVLLERVGVESLIPAGLPRVFYKYERHFELGAMRVHAGGVTLGDRISFGVDLRWSEDSPRPIPETRQNTCPMPKKNLPNGSPGLRSSLTPESARSRK